MWMIELFIIDTIQTIMHKPTNLYTPLTLTLLLQIKYHIYLPPFPSLLPSFPLLPDSLLSIHNPDFRLTIEAGGGGDGGLVLLYHRPAEGTPQIQLPSWAKIQGTEEVQVLFLERAIER